MPIPHYNFFFNKIFFVLLIMLFAWWVTACTDNTRPKPDPAPEAISVNPAYEAALAKREAVWQSRSPQERGLRLLEEAEAWRLAGEYGRAEESLARSQRLPLSALDKNRQQWLYFALFSDLGRFNEAKTAYIGIDNALLPLNLQADYQKQAAAFQEQLGNYLEAAAHLVYFEAFLTDTAAKESLNAKIFQLLRSSPKSRRVQVAATNPGGSFGAWLALVQEIDGVPKADPAHLKALRTWQQQNPAHPANDAWLPRYQQEIAALFPREEKIAVLLPLSGRFGEFASAIRAGLRLAQTQTPNSPTLVFYDTAQIGVINAYQQALAEGASKVLGPLQKGEIDELATAFPSMPVFTLALNQRSQSQNQIIDLYEFALLPEEEVNAVIAKAASLGRSQTLLIAPDDAWGRRIETATKAASDYVDSVQTVFYSSRTQDFSAIAQKARQALLLPEASSIFIVAKRPTAQLLLSALRSDSVLSSLPILTTSYLYDGEIDPVNDEALNGLYFCDLPWMHLPKPMPPSPDGEAAEANNPSESSNPSPAPAKNNRDAAPKAPPAPLTPTDPIVALYQEAWRQYPTLMQKHPRLVAFGIDAYRLQNALPLLATPLSGVTGRLSHNQQTIVRRLTWYRFENGQIVSE